LKLKQVPAAREWAAASQMTEATISLVDASDLLSLFGACDQNVRHLSARFSVHITHRDGQIRIVGDHAASVALATEAVEELKSIVERNGVVGESDLERIIGKITGDAASKADPISVSSSARVVKPRTSGQDRYVQAIRNHALTFSVGPAGTGKTYLAVALAVEALKTQQVRKIVLVRPAVEAGESLGYLPGDLQAKINPYLRPLLDALREMMDHDQIKRHMEEDVVEVVPLAYMRGRTLNDAFIILDEAQNTTVSQMKMFLTRMGENSKIVVAGDTTQIDLPQNTRSGFPDAIHRLRNIKGCAQVKLEKSDIVRHRLVQDIVLAYEDTDLGASVRKKSHRNR
jgi:phosphate starvation-inducible PhoH-like protein